MSEWCGWEIKYRNKPARSSLSTASLLRIVRPFTFPSYNDPHTRNCHDQVEMGASQSTPEKEVVKSETEMKNEEDAVGEDDEPDEW